MRGATSWQSRSGLYFTLRWYRTTDSLNRTACVLTYNDSQDTGIAYTEHYYRGNSAFDRKYPELRDWDSCIIRINTVNDTYATMAHEFGHVMGLAHNNDDPNSIMCQTGAGRTADVPSSDDIAGLNYLYS